MSTESHDSETPQKADCNPRLVRIPTDAERAANHKALSKMHPGNRFRLMFGLPLLPEVNLTADPKLPAKTQAALETLIKAAISDVNAKGDSQSPAKNL